MRTSISVPDCLAKQLPKGVSLSRIVQEALVLWIEANDVHRDHTVETRNEITFCFTCSVVLK